MRFYKRSTKVDRVELRVLRVRNTRNCMVTSALREEKCAFQTQLTKALKYWRTWRATKASGMSPVTKPTPKSSTQQVLKGPCVITYPADAVKLKKVKCRLNPVSI
jgi:hypothetical protein